MEPIAYIYIGVIIFGLVVYALVYPSLKRQNKSSKKR